jgi:hypothetical protein
MTTDEAIALIPEGWRLRLANWSDPPSSGWEALLDHPDGRSVANEGDSPAEAVRLVAEEARRL